MTKKEFIGLRVSAEIKYGIEALVKAGQYGTITEFIEIAVREKLLLNLGGVITSLKEGHFD